MIKITIERVIILFLLVILAFRSCTGSATVDCDPMPAEVEIKEETVTTIDSVSNTTVKDQVPEKIPVIETPNRVERVKDPLKLSAKKRREVKEVYRYLDTTRLNGAIVFSEILSEGRILETNLVAEVDHQETTITKTVIVKPEGFYISPGIDYSPLGGLEAVETTIMFLKGNFGGSIGPYYNFRNIPLIPGVRAYDTGSLGLKVKIHIKL